MSDSEKTKEPDNVPQPVDTRLNPVHCSKCFEFNLREAEKCTACGAHLWVKCRKCGKKNVRTASRCIKCFGNLHPLAFLALPSGRRLFRNRKRKRILRVLGLFLLVAVIAWTIYKRLPEPERPRLREGTPL